VPLACGFTTLEIAEALDVRRKDVEEQLRRLREELQAEPAESLTR
jgi:DNA-directed RNA polymerase specialized sigma24 family protein